MIKRILLVLLSVAGMCFLTAVIFHPAIGAGKRDLLKKLITPLRIIHNPIRADVESTPEIIHTSLLDSTNDYVSR